MSVAAASPRHYLRTQIRWHWIELAFWIAALLPFVLTPSYLVLASQIAITALFALSLDLILGYAGIVSLGHAAFFGFGAYTAGIITKPWTIPIPLLGKEIFWAGWGEPLSGLVIAGCAAALLGYAMSFIIARFRHLPLIMLTLGLGLLMFEVANKASWLTGGADGLQGVRLWPLFGRFPFDLWGYTSYAYALGILFLLFLVCRRLTNSPFGLSLRGIRENIIRMRAIGAESRSHLRTIYTISAAIAGIAGALLTQTTETVSLGVIDFQRSADVLVILILGGAGRLYGGLIGAVIFMVARDQFSGINPQYWYFPIGAVLIVVVLFVPSGILGLPATLRQVAAAWTRYRAESRQAEFILRAVGITLLVLSVVAVFGFFGATLSTMGRPGIGIGVACLVAEWLVAYWRKRGAQLSAAAERGPP